MERPYTPECIIPRDGDFHDLEVFDYGDHVEIFDCAEDVHVSKSQLPRLIEALIRIRDKMPELAELVSQIPAKW